MRALCVVWCCHTATCYVSETCCVCRRTLLSPLDLYLATWIDHIRFADGMIIIKKRRSPKVAPFRRVMSGTLIPPVMTSASSDSPEAGTDELEVRLNVTREFGFFQNMLDLVPLPLTPAYTVVQDGEFPQETEAAAPLHSTRATAYVPAAAAGPTVTGEVLGVQVTMEVPTPFAPFFFLSNSSADTMAAIRGDVNSNIMAEFQGPGEVHLLDAAKLFCMEGRYIGSQLKCPWVVVTAVKLATEAYWRGVREVDNFWYYKPKV